MKMTKENFLNDLQKTIENSDEIEVWIDDENSKSKSQIIETEIKFGDDFLDFSANKFVRIVDLNLKAQLIAAISRDIEKGGEIMRCFIPHHLVKTKFFNKSFEIAICFHCNLFFSKINQKEFSGSLPDEKDCESKKIFDEIIEKFAVDMR